MLVLIAGITGNLGQPLAKSLLKRGHKVRGLGRSESKLESGLREQLESFVTISDYDDLAGLAKGVAGVDAVVCAYAPLQILHLEGQLMLWRASEKAGVKRFISASWNYDWRTMTVGQHETYDPILMFARQTALTSEKLKPIYIFTGVLAETLFAVPGHGNFSPAHNGVWDPATKEMHIWGPKSVVWHWTTEADCAEFTAAILERPDAEEVQYWSVCSGEGTLENIANQYGRIRGCDVKVLEKGDLNALRERAHGARAQGTPTLFWMYIGWFYQLFTVDGTWPLKNLDNDKLGVKTTLLEEFLAQNPTI
jgi:nucleoside-diphosphate-sugar epimerase